MKSFLLALFATLLLASPAVADCIRCDVERVHDGDTIVIRDSGGVQHHIRMEFIDAPELKQPYGLDAKRHLEAVLEGMDVFVSFDHKDIYNRDLGEVYVMYHNPDGFDPDRALNVNLSMVVDGYAWAYPHPKNQLYEDAEKTAREQYAGLWKNLLGEDKPEAPWIYRKRMKQEHAKPLQALSRMFTGI